MLGARGELRKVREMMPGRGVRIRMRTETAVEWQLELGKGRLDLLALDSFTSLLYIESGE